MAYEAGGRADKLGNYYEKKWLVSQYILLLCGKIQGVVHEPVQALADGIDIQVYLADNTLEHHQCKGFNNNSVWTVNALNKHEIFKKAANVLQSTDGSVYHFISASAAPSMRDLCERAKNSTGKLEDFLSQLNQALTEDFKSVAAHMGLDDDTVREYLTRMSFIQKPDDPYYENDLKNRLSLLITNHDIAYSLLLTYVESEQKYGHCVTQNDLELYLVKHGCELKQLQRDQSIPGKVRELNTRYTQLFSPIDEYTVREDILASMLSNIKYKKNMVLLGPAGVGKTGFIREMTNRLSEQDTPYLVLRLDAFPPLSNQSEWGQKMGLPDSPALCLHSIKSQQCPVLILDQLDAIRWTSNHNAKATSFMLGILNEIELINKENPSRPVLVVFACRKYDYDNDAAIQQLFAKKETSFEQIHIPLLNDDQLETRLGPSYAQYPFRLRELLRFPSNLYFWSKINNPAKAIASQRGLINAWWIQLGENARQKRLSTENLLSTIQRLNKFIDAGISCISKEHFPIVESLEFLTSEGMLVSDQNQNYHYVHQSIYDYFISNEMFEKVISGGTLSDALGDFNDQTPMKRYQFQMMLEALVSSDPSLRMFFQKVQEALSASNIRYYLKHVIFEVVGQFSEANANTALFIRRYLYDKEWQQPLTNAVLSSHPVFIRFLFESGELTKLLHDVKTEKTVLALLNTLHRTDDQLLASIIKEYAFQNEELDYELYRSMGFDIAKEAQESFDLRCQFIEKGVAKDELSFWMHGVVHKNPLRALEYLQCLAHYRPNQRSAELKKKEIEQLADALLQKGFEHFTKEFLWVHSQTNEYPIGISTFVSGDDWSCFSHEMKNARLLVEVLIESARRVAEIQAEQWLAMLHTFSPNAISNEIILHSLEVIPDIYADQVMTWLVNDFPNRLFCENGHSNDRLDITKSIIRKHIRHCSDAVYALTENLICEYSEKDERFKEKFKRYGAGYWKCGCLTDYCRLQRNLLPCLPNDRRSKKAYRIQQMAERKFSEDSMLYWRSTVGEAFSVHSPLGSKAELLSDKKWLEIINHPTTKSHFRWQDGIETTPAEFAADLRRLSKDNPRRIFQILMTADAPLHAGYLHLPFEIAAKEKAITLDEMIHLITVYQQQCMTDTAVSFCRMVEERADEDWPFQFVDMVCDVALHHNDPSENDDQRNDLAEKDVLSVETYALNSARGCAVYAIASLFHHHPEHREHLSKTISRACHDSHVAVRHAVLRCIAYAVNPYPSYAFDWYQDIGKQDIRNYAGREVEYFFFSFWREHSDEMKKIIEGLVFSDYSECRQLGRSLMIYCYFEHDLFTDAIEQEGEIGEHHTEHIIEECAAYLNNSEGKYHTKAVQLFVDHLCKWKSFEKFCDYLFSQNRLDPQNDMVLIRAAASAKPGRRLLANLAEYLDENNCDPSEVGDLLSIICKHYAEAKLDDSSDDHWRLREIESRLPKLVQRLYDLSETDKDIKIQCLDLWDEMYKDGIGVRWENE